MSKRSLWTALLASTLTFAGAAWAQDEEEGGEGEEAGEGSAGGGEESAATPSAGETAGELTTTAGDARGRIVTGATITLPGGPDDKGKYGTGNWIGVRINGMYFIDNKVSAGLTLPLAMVKPDLGPLSGETLGGFLVHGNYAVNDMITANVTTGLAFPGVFAYNPFVAPWYIDVDGYKFGAVVGATVGKKMNKLSLNAGAKVVYQLDSDTDDEGKKKALMTLMIPVCVMFEMTPKIAVGAHTGIYGGQDFAFGADKGATLPVIAEAKYSLNDNMNVGLAAGLGTLLTDDMGGLYKSAGDSLFVGLSAGWQNK